VPLNIRNPEADRLAAELAALAGETKTAAVIQALRERLHRLKHAPPVSTSPGGRLADHLDSIALHLAQRPKLDDRDADAILGYDNHGIPGSLGRRPNVISNSFLLQRASKSFRLTSIRSSWR
jgi:antitoxin VapB